MKDTGYDTKVAIEICLGYGDDAGSCVGKALNLEEEKVEMDFQNLFKFAKLWFIHTLMHEATSLLATLGSKDLINDDIHSVLLYAWSCELAVAMDVAHFVVSMLAFEEDFVFP